MSIEIKIIGAGEFTPLGDIGESQCFLRILRGDGMFTDLSVTEEQLHAIVHFGVGGDIEEALPGTAEGTNLEEADDGELPALRLRNASGPQIFVQNEDEPL